MTKTTLTPKDLEDLTLAVESGLLDTSRFRGREIVCTGEMGLSRVDMHKLLRVLGARPSDRVSYGTGYLVVGNTKEWGRTNKVRQATRLGVRVLSEAEFTAMIQVRS